MIDEHVIAAHTTEVEVDRAFAWAYWTDVSNWDDPPASFILAGPFAAGSAGTTSLPGAPPLTWTIAEAQDGHATIEMALDGAAIRFAWTFASLGQSRTAMTQRITLVGRNSAAYLSDARAGLSTISAGMARLADGMIRARGRLTSGED